MSEEFVECALHLGSGVVQHKKEMSFTMDEDSAEDIDCILERHDACRNAGEDGKISHNGRNKSSTMTLSLFIRLPAVCDHQ